MTTITAESLGTAVTETGTALILFAKTAGLTLEEADQLLRFTQLHQFYVWLDDLLAVWVADGQGNHAELVRQKRIVARKRVQYQTAVATIIDLVQKSEPDFVMPYLVQWAGEVV